MKEFSIVCGIAAAILFLIGYVGPVAMPSELGPSPGLIYMARNIGLVMLIVAVFSFSEATTSDALEIIALLVISAMMATCYALGTSTMSGLVPTWFTNVWVQAIVGGLSVLAAMYCMATNRPEADDG